MRITTVHLKHHTTIKLSSDVSNDWSIGIVSLSGLIVLLVGVLCLFYYVGSRLCTSAKNRSTYEKLGNRQDLEYMDGGYCKLTGKALLFSSFINLSIIAHIYCDKVLQG
jgi:hypothetical protein